MLPSGSKFSREEKDKLPEDGWYGSQVHPYKWVILKVIQGKKKNPKHPGKLLVVAWRYLSAEADELLLVISARVAASVEVFG